MKLTPTGNQPGVPSTTTPDPVKAADAKARAVAILTGQGHQAQEQIPVPNPNKVTPEDFTAISSPSREESPDNSAYESNEVEDTTPEVEEPRRKPVSRELEMLARKEKALRLEAQRRAKAFRDRETALKLKESQMAEKEKAYETGYISKDTLKSNPLKILTDAGITYDDLTQAVLNQQELGPQAQAELNALKNEIKALKQAQEDALKSSQESQSTQYQAAVRQIKRDVRSLVQQDPAFELTRATNSVNDVVELITRTYDKEGVMLTAEEAAAEVEKYLEQETEKLTKTQKMRRRISEWKANPGQGASKQKPQGSNKSQPAQQPQMRTLTNATGTTRQLGARERAIAAFKGELS